MTEKKMTKIMVKDVNAKQAQIDSLTSECWVKDIQIGRYEVILDRISDVDSSLVEEASSDVE
jgi:hypothetical protein